MAMPDEPRMQADLDAARQVIAAFDADLEAAREVVSARDAELDRIRTLAARLVAHLLATRGLIPPRDAEIARLRRVEATTAGQWIKRGLQLALGPRWYERGKRLYRSIRRLPPPVRPQTPGPPADQLPVIDGQPVRALLACPSCAHSPLLEGPAALSCPDCALTFPIVDGTPVFVGTPLERVLSRSVPDPAPDGRDVVERLYRLLEPGGVIRRPPTFTPSEPLFRLRLPGARRPGVRRLLFLTHNLKLEGAPIFLLSLATTLPRDRYEIGVLSLEDGPLRGRYEAAGIVISLADALSRLGSPPEYESMMTALSRWVRVGDFDLVFCNTLFCFWGVAVARLAGRPSVWKIHESVDWQAFLALLPGTVAAEALDDLRSASRLTFTADATRALFREFDTPGRVRTIHCGLDVGAIEAYARAGERSALRAAHGVKQGERVISVIGTTCERKGQLDFLRMAAALRARRAETLHFYVVGAREGEYLDALKRFVRDTNLDSVVFVPETPHVYDFYLMTDIFVCPSYQESFPLVVLEAMAFGLPIVATAVFGIPEALTHGRDALLTRPGDVEGLATAVAGLLDDSALANRLAGSARETVARRFTLDRMARDYDRLFTEVWGQEAGPGRTLSDSSRAADGVG